jgi:hypothetical protein
VPQHVASTACRRRAPSSMHTGSAPAPVATEGGSDEEGPPGTVAAPGCAARRRRDALPPCPGRGPLRRCRPLAPPISAAIAGTARSAPRYACRSEAPHRRPMRPRATQG